jgi:putative ABC transport system substrate-binding protein
MRRREFISLLGGAAAASSWPLPARAQQKAVPTIGFLNLGAQNQFADAAFRRGLAEAGYIPGQNVAIEYRSANLNTAILPQLAADLVKRQVAVIVANGPPYVAAAAKAATSTIPIVFAIADDPVKYGLVASYNRPGSNATGMNFLSTELAGKRLDLLVQLAPHATRVAYLMGPHESPVFDELKAEMLAAGGSLGREILVFEVRRFDFEASFAALAEQGAQALVVSNFNVYFDEHEIKSLNWRAATKYRRCILLAPIRFGRPNELQY